MDQACETFRTLWLERALEAGARAQRAAHLEACEACRLWTGGAQAQIAAFANLERLTAPAELEARLFLARGASESEAAERWARRLADLQPLAAPAVLDRLVDEELRAPESARARRFAGDLPRQDAPTVLEGRVFRSGRRSAVPRRRLSLIAGAAAAAGLLAVGLALLNERERPFTVHHARPARPHAMVAELAGAWTGDILRAEGVAGEEQR